MSNQRNTFSSGDVRFRRTYGGLAVSLNEDEAIISPGLIFPSSQFNTRWMDSWVTKGNRDKASR